MNISHCDIAILRPSAVEAINLYNDSSDLSERLYGERVASIIDEIRSLLETAASEIGIQICLTEYQIHKNTKNTLLSTKRAKEVKGKM